MNRAYLCFIIGDMSKIRIFDECDFFVAFLHSEIQHLGYDSMPYSYRQHLNRYMYLLYLTIAQNYRGIA